MSLRRGLAAAVREPGGYCDCRARGVQAEERAARVDRRLPGR